MAEDKDLKEIKKDLEMVIGEVKNLKEQLKEARKIGMEFQDRYEEMLKKEEQFLGEMNSEIEREITVVVIGNIKKTINKELASLKMMRRSIRAQVRNQIKKEIDKEMKKQLPEIINLVKAEIKNKSVEIVSQLRRQTGKKLEKEVIEHVKDATSVLREQKEESERRAIIDGLTGAYNRRYFETKMEEELNLAKRFRNKLSLIMLDIDHFKKINDTYGHGIGDVVLQETIEVVRGQISPVDSLCRYGGEEFTVIMPETDIESAMKTAEKIRKAIEEHAFYGDDKLINVTISLGAAEYPTHAILKQALVERADAALYDAKHSGRNNVKQAKKDEQKDV